MFFSRQPAAAPPVPSSGTPAASGADEVGPVLDALGQVLAQYVQLVMDLPDRPTHEVQQELEAWRRHALLGTPAPGTAQRPAVGRETGEHAVQESGNTEQAPPAGGIRQRNWVGMTQAFSTHRREERRYVETALSDLRDALWTCVERSHHALLAEQQSSPVADEQVARVRSALDRLETGAVKSEIQQAMQHLEQVTRQRQNTQREAFGQLAARVEQLGSQLEEARRASETDALTGLGNRLLFERQLTRLAALHALSGQPLSVVVIDLDFLKTLNDVHGHHVGDAALVTLANAMPRVFIGESDVTCRLGGDEFGVLLPGTTLALAQRLAERFRSQLSVLSWPYREQAGALSASAGAAEWQPPELLADCLRRADAAMYAVKIARTPPVQPAV